MGILDAIHRGVRVAQQGLRVDSMIRIDGDADACLDGHVTPIERHRLLEAGKDRAHGTPGAGHAGRGQERGEFIAAQAGHRIRLPHRALEARPNFL